MNVHPTGQTLIMLSQFCFVFCVNQTWLNFCFYIGYTEINFNLKSHQQSSFQGTPLIFELVKKMLEKNQRLYRKNTKPAADDKIFSKWPPSPPLIKSKNPSKGGGSFRMISPDLLWDSVRDQWVGFSGTCGIQWSVWDSVGGIQWHTIPAEKKAPRTVVSFKNP